MSKIQESKKKALDSLLGNKPSNPIKEHDDISDEAPKQKRATFLLDANLHTELKLFAVKQDKNMAEVVETAIRTYLASQEK